MQSAIYHTLRVVEHRLQVNGGIADAVAAGRPEQRSDLAVRYLSWKKFFNFIGIELQLRFGVARVRGAPYEWEIDTTNICQLKCPLCHTGLGNVDREQGVMHYSLFTELVDQIQDHCIWLTLYSWGEPFLNPRIHEFVAYAHKKRIATIISTNLNRPLSDEMAENIIRAGLDVMIISLDGVTQEVYEQYRVNGHLDRVLKNVELLVRKKRELGMDTPHLEWQFIVMRQNEHQIDDARLLAEELGVDSIIFKRVDFPHGMDDPQLAQQWLPRDHPEYRRLQPFSKPYREDGERCWRLWRSAVVNWDGGFAPCCYLTDATDDFGQASETPLAQIWNNENYRAARGMFKEGFELTRFVGCLYCPVYLGSSAAKHRGPVDIPLTTVSKPVKTPVEQNGVSPVKTPVEQNGASPVKTPIGQNGASPAKTPVEQNGAGSVRLHRKPASVVPEPDDPASR